MHELFDKLLSEIKGAWRFRWYAMLVAWLGCVVGWVVVLMLPDQYEAEAQFYVDTTTRLDEVMGGVIIDSDDRSQIALVRQAMLSTPVLERVARETDLDLRATNAVEKQALIEGLARRIEIEATSVRRQGSRVQDDGIYRISYRDRERRKTLEVVDQLLDTFREDVVSGRAQGSDETVEFLQKEIAGYSQQLRLQEQAIADFKSKNVGLLPGEGGGYFNTLQKAISEQRAIEAERSVLVDRRNALLRQLSGENPIVSSDSSSGGGIGIPQNELDVRINELEKSIEEMLTRYTDKWPDVIATRDQLEQLYKRRDEALAEMAASGSSSATVSNNPVYQQIQITLNETKVEIAAVEGRLIGVRQQVAELQDRVGVIPEIEARLAELTRDYDQIRNVYAELRERLEQEQLRRKRIGWDGVTFRIIDPPKGNIEPVSPMRLQLLLLVLVGALGAGGGLAYLLHQANPVFMDQKSLRAVTGLPVLGGVSMTWQSRHRAQRRKELTTLLASAAALIIVAVFVVLFMDVGVQAGNELRRIASL